MPNPFDIPLMQLGRTIVALKPVLIDAIGVEALHFVDDNFVKQGFQGGTFQPWPKRAKKQKGANRALLVQTGALRRSIKKTDSASSTTISTDIIYAKIHNEGGDIRHPYREVILSFRGAKGGKLKLAKTNTEAQQRKVTQLRRSSIYNHVIKMPKRQFMPVTATDSPVLTERCTGIIIKKITEALPK